MALEKTNKGNLYFKVTWHLLRNVMTQRSKHDLTFYHEDDGVWYVETDAMEEDCMEVSREVLQ